MFRETRHLTDTSVGRLPVPVLSEGVERKAMGSAVRDYFDDKVTGFHVRVSPSGRKTFALVYAMRDTGVRRRFTIGHFPNICSDDARALATLRLAEATAGSDPQVERARKRVNAGYTVHALSEAFLAVRSLKPSTRALYQQLLKKHILPRFQSLAVTDVMPGDVSRMHAAMSSHRAIANQCVRLLHTMFQ